MKIVKPAKLEVIELKDPKDILSPHNLNPRKVKKSVNYYR